MEKKNASSRRKAVKAPNKTAAAAASKQQRSTSTKVQKQKTVTIHYYRFHQDYEDWGVHLWDTGENVIDPAVATEWTEPLLFDAEDQFGRKVTIPLKNGYGKLGFLIHKGEEKDPGNDMEFKPNSKKHQVWLVQGNP